jgi:curved DNA-binding protein CbpA
MNVDPYKILNLSRNYTLAQLKENYKRIALELHPDKYVGSKEVAKATFQILTQCYKTLLQEWKDRQQHDHQEVRQQVKQFLAAQDAQPQPTKQKFDIEHFNTHFQNTRLRDTFDDGYEDWMQRNDPEEKAHSKKSAFIVHYKEPVSAHGSKLGYVELGLDKVRDFSGENDSLKRLNFMDYRLAHTTEKIIDPDKVKARREYKNISDLENERSNIKMDDKELDRYMRMKKREEQQDNMRMDRVRKRDAFMQDHFQKAQPLFLS